jgi:hypothetical protein
LVLNPPGSWTGVKPGPFQVKGTLSEDHKQDSWLRLLSLGGVSEEFFDKYAWNFLKYVHWLYIYIHLRASLRSKRPATREPGKVEKEVLAIPSRAAEYGYGHTDNSFRVPDSSMCDLWFIRG